MDLDSLSTNAKLDPFADIDAEQEREKQEEEKKAKSDLVHIRVQQRNGRKCITTVQGLNAQMDHKKILKVLKKEKCCNGCIVEDDDMGSVLQLQGDQRDAVRAFLLENELVEPEKIKKHGTG